MNTIIVFDSLYGNTERVARTIASAMEPLGDVKVVPTTDVPTYPTPDLWIIGGPTHNHGMSKPLAAFVGRFTRGSLKGVPVATFDTRIHGARLLTGSAARTVAGRLRGTGCRLVAEPESFFVERGPTQVDGGRPDPSDTRLEAGELERARAWGASLADTIARI